jgi:hypothetical protein
MTKVITITKFLTKNCVELQAIFCEFQVRTSKGEKLSTFVYKGSEVPVGGQGNLWGQGHTRETAKWGLHKKKSVEVWVLQQGTVPSTETCHRK